jgi:hypothetical protein
LNDPGVLFLKLFEFLWSDNTIQYLLPPLLNDPNGPVSPFTNHFYLLDGNPPFVPVLDLLGGVVLLFLRGFVRQTISKFEGIHKELLLPCWIDPIFGLKVLADVFLVFKFLPFLLFKLEFD